MMHGYGWLGNYGVFGWIGMLISLVLMVVVVVGLIWLFFWLARKSLSSNQNMTMNSQLGPREILQIRYARGEITREQYFEISDDLK